MLHPRDYCAIYNLQCSMNGIVRMFDDGEVSATANPAMQLVSRACIRWSLYQRHFIYRTSPTIYPQCSRSTAPYGMRAKASSWYVFVRISCHSAHSQSHPTKWATILGPVLELGPVSVLPDSMSVSVKRSYGIRRAVVKCTAHCTTTMEVA